MLKLKFFASLREALACSDEQLALPADVKTLGALRAKLAARGGEWTRLTESRSLRCAVNQVMADDDTAVGDGDEVAFFPPVTGG
jgi:molybdopterin synthase sulfur carrier subunit